MDHQYLAKLFLNVRQSFGFWCQYDHILLYNLPKTELFYGTSPPPVKQDTTYTKHVYRHSKHYVGVGSCFTGGNDVAEAKNRKCCHFIKVVLYK